MRPATHTRSVTAPTWDSSTTDRARTEPVLHSAPQATSERASSKHPRDARQQHSLPRVQRGVMNLHVLEQQLLVPSKVDVDLLL